ncbi:hypothetical protein G2W53_041282 [Senna tora]|uniref:DUF659 domain-containing protein n=1 Tax=Senna tora TaxID=362788 RepID=A0A834SEU6_9FABA|nr:hypothetical protein G2W53_041282 [Senna tora]
MVWKIRKWEVVHQVRFALKKQVFAGRSKQATLNQLLKVDLREEASRQIARFFYTSAIPFNCVKNLEWENMCELIAKKGPGFKPPTFHEVCEKFLNPKGTVFLSSKDVSDVSKTVEKVFEMLDEILEQVGQENVVQVIADNAGNYKAAGEMLMAKRKRHFTKGKDLIRPAVTRFATAYLTLSCLFDNKAPLMTMFSSQQWKSSRFTSLEIGKKAIGRLPCIKTAPTSEPEASISISKGKLKFGIAGTGTDVMAAYQKPFVPH